MTLTLVSDNPRSHSFGYITETHTRLLENQIKSNPCNWLWTHKRWKREVPINLEEVRNVQEKAFNERFRS